MGEGWKDTYSNPSNMVFHQQFCFLKTLKNNFRLSLHNFTVCLGDITQGRLSNYHLSKRPTVLFSSGLRILMNFTFKMFSHFALGILNLYLHLSLYVCVCVLMHVMKYLQVGTVILVIYFLI